MTRGLQRCACQCHWDWSWLNGCFGTTGISPSYIDHLMVLERYGQFLIIECKHIDEPISEGQKRLLYEFSRKHGCLGMILWGETPHPVTLQYCMDGRWYDKQTTNQTDFQGRIARWFNKANMGELANRFRP